MVSAFSERMSLLFWFQHTYLVLAMPVLFHPCCWLSRNQNNSTDFLASTRKRNVYNVVGFWKKKIKCVFTSVPFASPRRPSAVEIIRRLVPPRAEAVLRSGVRIVLCWTAQLAFPHPTVHDGTPPSPQNKSSLTLIASRRPLSARVLSSASRWLAQTPTAPRFQAGSWHDFLWTQAALFGWTRERRNVFPGFLFRRVAFFFCRLLSCIWLSCDTAISQAIALSPHGKPALFFLNIFFSITSNQRHKFSTV